MEPGSFLYEAAPHRLLVGPGMTARLSDELAALGARRPFLVSTPGQLPKALARLAGVAFAGQFGGAALHTPVAVTREALAIFDASGADAIVSFGGGSATGLGKAIALRSGRPFVAIGTTYGGSEMTALIGETENGVKRTQRDRRVLPAVSIYDLDLTMGLPAGTSVASGLNAMAHAVEATYAADANPIITAIAVDAIAALHMALPRIARDPADRHARGEALRGACAAGLCLNAVSMGLHHKLCHTIGGTFDLPHAETHAIVLPHAMAYNRPAVGAAFARIGAALGGEAVRSIAELVQDIAPCRSLRDLGMPESGIDHATLLVLANPYANPRPIEEAAIRGLIRRAWAGERAVS